MPPGRFHSLTCVLFIMLLAGCHEGRHGAGEAREPLFLNAAAQDRALFLTWNGAPDWRPVTLYWRPVGSNEWHHADGGTRGWSLVEGLENGVVYECYAERVLENGEKVASQPVTQTPKARSLRPGHPYLTSQQEADGWLKLKRIDPGTLHLRGQRVTTWGPSAPDGLYTDDKGKLVLALLRHADGAFRPPVAPRPPNEVRTVLKHALWPKFNPFDEPQQFAMPISPIKRPLVESVTGFVSAASFAVNYHPQLSSRCTHFVPALPPSAAARQHSGKFAIFVHGHDLLRLEAIATIERLLERGWQVIAMDMPLSGANSLDQSTRLYIHNDFSSWPSDGFSPVALFLQPLKAVVDKIYREHGNERDLTVMLIGRSGGGWTSYMYGALDERVHYVVSIAGGMPMSQWLKEDRVKALDYEQLDPLIYGVVPYEDIMPAAGSRAAFFVFNEHDPCCFRMSPDDPFVHYLETAGRTLDKPIGVYVDRDNTTHSFSDAAFAQLDAFLAKVEAAR